MAVKDTPETATDFKGNQSVVRVQVVPSLTFCSLHVANHMLTLSNRTQYGFVVMSLAHKHCTESIDRRERRPVLCRCHLDGPGSFDAQVL